MPIVKKSQLVSAIRDNKVEKIVIKRKNFPLKEYEVYSVEFDEIGRNKVILKASSEKRPSILRSSIVYKVSNFLSLSLQNDYPIYSYIEEAVVLLPVREIKVEEEKNQLTLLV